MPWYRTGTVAVTVGQTTVTGTGTNFSANSRVGDALQGPDGRWYEVTNIASATVMSILPAYQGATVSAGAYGLAPMQGYVKESADRLRQFVEQYGSTLAMFGGATDVATLRSNIGAAKSGANNDITSITGMTTALSIAQGGTGAATAAGARTALGVVPGSAVGNVQLVGDRNSPLATTINTWGNSFQTWESTATAGRPEASSFGTIINAAYGATGTHGTQIIMSATGRIWFRAGDYATASIREIYHTGNTTRGSGGALSAASPIVRIADAANSERRDLLEQSFIQVGWGAANDEAPGVSVERVDIGVYRITGSLGLAIEGWRIQDPCSPDGGRTLGITESEQDEHGVVTVRLYKQRWTLDEDGEMHLGKGVPMDVPLNSWIDVRLQMPAVEIVPPPAA